MTFERQLSNRLKCLFWLMSGLPKIFFKLSHAGVHLTRDVRHDIQGDLQLLFLSPHLGRSWPMKGFKVYLLVR